MRGRGTKSEVTMVTMVGGSCWRSWGGGLCVVVGIRAGR